MKNSLLVIFMFSLPFTVFSQKKLTDNTLQLDESKARPDAQIEDMSWYAQRWEGEGFGAYVEENFRPLKAEL